MDASSKDKYARRPLFARPLLAAAVTATALAPTGAQAAFDIFLKLEGIPGESQSSKHKDEIDVLSWNDAFAVISNAGEGRATTRTLCSGVTVSKLVDRASVKLLEALMTNGTIATGKLVVAQTVTFSEFYTIDLTNIKVTSQSQSLSQDTLYENVTLKPASYKFNYRPQDEKGGLGPAVTFSGSC